LICDDVINVSVRLSRFDSLAGVIGAALINAGVTKANASSKTRDMDMLAGQARRGEKVAHEFQERF
jgi:hypothetical protein